MDEKQKTYIEDNIDLIDKSEWKEFFKHAPRSCGEPLYEAGIPFLEELGYVPNSAFYRSNIQTIDVPDGVTSIGKYVFTYSKGLTSITIPSSVKSIGEYAFYDCSSLKNIKFAENSKLESIGWHTFSWCASLTNIEIPNSVTSIESYAFSSCTSLTSIKIPDSVTNISSSAFEGCESLTSIEIPNSVNIIGYGAFCDCAKIEITYGGTTAEWKDLIGYDRGVFGNTIYTCTCTDGVVKKSR